MVSSIDLESLVVGYKSPVIENVNLTVNSGEIVALIGPNGAGKSTVLKTITRQLQKLDGEIRICEVNESDMSEEDMSKAVSMV
ncbi:ATP-binding cassette domain-containing protein, partial [Pseudobutyrivibrio sp.]|uniref:ATP-binding cassette domain-containing protein n=1 Tax=Pseudobutyrivibrio sp. TaxID=2014367 RepID=UPI00386349F6